MLLSWFCSMSNPIIHLSDWFLFLNSKCVFFLFFSVLIIIIIKVKRDRRCDFCHFPICVMSKDSKESIFVLGHATYKFHGIISLTADYNNKKLEIWRASYNSSLFSLDFFGLLKIWIWIFIFQWVSQDLKNS